MTVVAPPAAFASDRWLATLIDEDDEPFDGPDFYVTQARICRLAREQYRHAVETFRGNRIAQDTAWRHYTATMRDSWRRIQAFEAGSVAV